MIIIQSVKHRLQLVWFQGKLSPHSLHVPFRHETFQVRVNFTEKVLPTIKKMAKK